MVSSAVERRIKDETTSIVSSAAERWSGKDTTEVVSRAGELNREGHDFSRAANLLSRVGFSR